MLVSGADMFLELVGGICIAIGFLTRPFALLCLIEMIVIIFKAHLPNGWGFSVQGGGAEFPVMARGPLGPRAFSRAQ